MLKPTIENKPVPKLITNEFESFDEAQRVGHGAFVFPDGTFISTSIAAAGGLPIMTIIAPDGLVLRGTINTYKETDSYFRYGSWSYSVPDKPFETRYFWYNIKVTEDEFLERYLEKKAKEKNN